MSNRLHHGNRLRELSLPRRHFLGRALAIGLGTGALGLLQACAPQVAPSPSAPAASQPTTAPTLQPTTAPTASQPTTAPAVSQPTAAPAVKVQFKTVNAGFLTIAMNGEMPMTSVKDDKIIGTDGTLIAMIAEKLGLKPKPSLMEWSATIESVKTGRTDVMLGHMGWTKARSEVLCLTDSLYYTNRTFVQKKGSAVDSLDKLAGKTFGTVTGFTFVPEMKKVPGVKEVKLYDTSDACIRDVVAGRLDVGALDDTLVDYLILKNPDWGLENIPVKYDKDFPILTGRNHAVMGMNVDNHELFHAINQGVKWIWKTGANKRELAEYGSSNPVYLQPPDPDPRLGVDRDKDGNIIGPCKEGFKDFSDLFK